MVNSALAHTGPVLRQHLGGNFRRVADVDRQGLPVQLGIDTAQTQDFQRGIGLQDTVAFPRTPREQ